MGGPALLDAQAAHTIARVNALTEALRNKVSMAAIADGGTTQASGAGVALNFDADVAAGDYILGGVPVPTAAGTDVDSDAGISFGATSGKEVTYALIAYFVGTTFTYLALPSAAAATGESIAPTEAAITAAAGTADWALIGDIVVVRTADTAVTFTPSYARRSKVGAKAALGAAPFAVPLATTEAGFRDYNG